MAEETIVRLKIISSSHTPDEISVLVGVPCDVALRIGDNRGKSLLKVKEHEWQLNSGLPKDESLETHLDHLLQRLAPHKVALHQVSKTDKVELSCVIYSDSIPALNFSKSQVQQLEEIGAGLDIDFYHNSPE